MSFCLVWNKPTSWWGVFKPNFSYNPCYLTDHQGIWCTWQWCFCFLKIVMWSVIILPSKIILKINFAILLQAKYSNLSLFLLFTCICPLTRYILACLLYSCTDVIIKLLRITRFLLLLTLIHRKLDLNRKSFIKQPGSKTKTRGSYKIYDSENMLDKKILFVKPLYLT